MIGWLKSNWRVTMLIIVVVLSTVVLFAPGIGGWPVGRGSMLH